MEPSDAPRARPSKSPRKVSPKKVAPKPTAAKKADDDTELDADPVTEDDAELGRIAKLKLVAEHWEARGRDAYDGLQARRADSATLDSVFGAAEHDEDVGGGILAGAVAFRLFLFLVPLVFVVVVVFGLASDTSGESSRSLAQSAGAAGLLARAFGSVSRGGIWGHLTAFALGSFAVFLTSRAALKVLRLASGLTWRVPTKKLEQPTKAAGIFVLVIIGALLLVQLVGALRDVSFGLGLVATMLFVLIPAALWGYFSLHAFPHPDGIGWKAVLPGSLLVGVGIQMLHLFTIYWIARQVDSKSETYGAIGIALALLFWSYLMGRILVAGMVLNASLWYRTHSTQETDELDEVEEDA
jgi:uncharacterized BrkB/YihY/UPF0761 family membrane protein